MLKDMGGVMSFRTQVNSVYRCTQKKGGWHEHYDLRSRVGCGKFFVVHV